MRNKNLSLKKIGWKRIVRNFQRFGWDVSLAEDITTVDTTTTYTARLLSEDKIHISSSENKKYRTRIFVSLYRYDKAIYEKSYYKFIEFLYNIFYFIRKILAWFIPIDSVVIVLATFMWGADVFTNPTSLLFVFWFVIWFIARCMENFLSFIAEKYISKGEY